MREFADRGRVCYGVKEFLWRVRREGRGRPLLGLLTGNTFLGAEIKLRHFGLWQQFELGVFGDHDEDRNALGWKALALARERFGGRIHPQEMVIIGDTPADVVCGKTIGARTLAVATGGADWEELERAGPDLLVPNLAEVVLDDLTECSV